MGSLSPRLQLATGIRQVLTPGLVQMVTVLHLNRLELKEMIASEIAQNPVLEEAADGGEEITQEEVHALLEAERAGEPADQSLRDAMDRESAVLGSSADAEMDGLAVGSNSSVGGVEIAEREAADVPAAEPKSDLDPFDEIDFDDYFKNYLDPGYKTAAPENVEKASFETFLPSPVTLADHLRNQLSVLVVSERVRDAADSIIGNLDENGYVMATVEELADAGEHTRDEVEAALRMVHTLDPSGIGARDLRECLLIQLEGRNGRDGVAWQIIANHLKLLETKQFRELAKVLGRPPEHIQIAITVIKTLDPRPGLRHSGPGVRAVEPDVYISKDGDRYLIELNDDDLPQLRLNPHYKRMLDRDQEPDKEVRNYVKERYASALQLMKNIEQRKHTILRVCHSIIRRQAEFLESGIDCLKPMMIKEVAEEIGVHPSTVSRAVASKYAHTPQGVFELRYFFSEAVQGPSGSATPLLILKRRVKKMIEDEDNRRPLTDEQITERLQSEGIEVTRRTVAKYREDMKIPSTHQRRVRN